MKSSSARTLLVTLLAMLLVAGPATAAVNNPIPANQFEEITDTFVDDDAVFAWSTVDIAGGEICIVNNVDTMNEASCESPAWGGSNTIVGIGTTYSIIAGPTLYPGTWKLLSTNSVGEPTGLSFPFTVTPCPTCDRSVTDAIVAEWKARAAQMKFGTDVMCTAWALQEAAEIPGMITAAHGKVMDLVDRANKYESGAVGFLGTVVPIGAGFGGGIAFPSVDSAITAGQTKAMEILKNLVCTLREQYNDIVDDPPDPNFDNVFTPTFATIDPLGAASTNSLATSIDAQNAYTEAALHAFERYQGAQAANNETGQHKQARQMGEMTRELVQELRTSAKALRDYADMIDALPDPEFAGPVVPDQATSDQMKGVYDRVRTSGFTADELTELASRGYTADQIAIIRSHFSLIDPSVVPINKSLGDIARDTATLFEQQIDGSPDNDNDGFDGVARNVAAVGGRLNAAPVASFNADPVEGFTPLNVDFTDTSTDDGDELTVAWDFGDGTQGSGATTSHSYLAAGTYTVTETVSDYLTSSSTTKEIHVGEGKVIVEALASPPAPGEAFSFSGDLASFSVSSGGTKSFWVTAGSYGVTADSRLDYAVTNVVCDDGASSQPSTPVTATGSATYAVEAGETVKCTFTNKPLRSLTVNKAGTGSGTVTSDPAGIDCGFASCQHDYPDGTVVTLHAAEDSGSNFTGWSGEGCSGTGDCVVTMSQARSVTATFDLPVMYALSVIRSGSGSGTVVSDKGIVNCGFTCGDYYEDGTVVTLSATADAGSTFAGWSGEGCTGTGNCVVTMDAIKTVTAVFTMDVPGNSPPTAAFTATPDHGPGPLHVDLDASGSSDSDGVILAYQWDYGDGSLAGSGITSSHSYEFAGTYTITLTVTDDDNEATLISHQVTVESDAPPNVAPTAAFTATPDSGAAPLGVSFDPSASSDSDGTIASYSWEYGDGTVETTYTTAPAGHVYTLAGTYKAKLVVTDNDGAASDAVEHQITVAGGGPELQDDTLSVVKAASLDVLGNDLDPDGQLLTVVGETSPAHGTAKCLPNGGCLYTADPDYTGGDEFTYTARDPDGHEASATVHVDVAAPPPFTGVPLGQDDEAVTRAGTPVQIDVISNDSGEGSLTVVGSSDPPHGTATCGSDGTCQYTPDAGFSGSDGFSYTLEDGNGAQTTAEAHVLVAPATAGFGATATGSPDPIASGADAHWGAGARGTPAGVSANTLHALTPPTITATLSGDHAVKPSSVDAAPGWTADPVAGDGHSVSAHAGSGALLGEAMVQSLAKPLPPTSQGTGGDGHVPILVGTKVFAFFHHSQPTSVTCIDRTTGQRCPGYPIALNMGTDNIPGPAAVVDGRIYTRLLPSGSYAQSAPLALYCWDTTVDRSCGLVVVERALRTDNPSGSPPVLVAGKIWIASDTGKLYCVNPATQLACATASLATGLTQQVMDIVTHGSRVFVSSSEGTACLDVSAGTKCAGWSSPKQLSGYNLLNRYSAQGVVIGVCGMSTVAMDCVNDATPGTTTSHPALANLDGTYDLSAEAESGTRTLFGSLSYPGLGCYDWTTMAPCTGNGYNQFGWIIEAPDLSFLPTAYGAAWDGSCAIGLGDPGLVFTVDPRGVTPCGSLAGAQETVDLRDQRCDGAVGSATWSQVGLADSSAGELDSVQVTVRDAATHAVLATGNLASGTLDLSGIDASAHPEISVEATATADPGSNAWSDHVPPKIRISWHSDPRQLCFGTTTEEACAPAPTTIGVDAAIAGASGAASKNLTVTHDACPTSPKQPTPDPTPPTQPPPATPDPPAETAEQAVLGAVFSCTDKRVVLEDVYEDRGRVHLFGYAVKKYVGQKVAIVFAGSGKPVARTVVKPDGSFQASAPLPPKKLRKSTKARYQARIGAERSLNLKLVRRMVVTNLKSSAGKVTITGRVIPPLATKPKDRAITLQRVVACKKMEKIATFTPKANGAFTITVKTPAGVRAAVYRLTTLVRVSGSKRSARTYTLPRSVAFR